MSPRGDFIALIRYDLPDPAVPVMTTCSGSGGGLHHLVLRDEKQGCCKQASVVYSVVLDQQFVAVVC